MERYLCIHGHFYQPARENPWLEAIELQEGASPYHDWNEKITAECYLPNGCSNLLDDNGKIRAVLNNYSKISFNFGPTLLHWLKENNQMAYRNIIKADESSSINYSGHGSAIAQAYNHTILPLSSERDKRIQIIWAIRSFELDFGRRPEGIWLPETAVDNITLQILADMQIEFTILSPNQASRVRKIPNDAAVKGETSGFGWTDVSEGKINTRMPYLCRPGGGREINIFFYDNDISTKISFGDLLKNGIDFAKNIIDTPGTEQDIPEIICIASDGETYGHHHKFGDLALAYCLDHIDSCDQLQLTVFGEYLEKYSPLYEVEIIENSSWSCSHGLSRWMDDCGCQTADRENKGWNQKWRKPLRKATDELTGKLSSIYDEEIKKYVNKRTDPDKIVEDYIYVINDRSKMNIKRFLKAHTGNRPQHDNSSILELLEMYRQSLLMQSSDGWFFDDISRTEPIQLMRHAARAFELAAGFSDLDLQKEYIAYLSNAKSNRPGLKTGGQIYNEFVKSSIYDFKKIAAAVSYELFFNGSLKPSKTNTSRKIFCYSIGSIDFNKLEDEVISVISGRFQMRSDITYRHEWVVFAVFYFKEIKKTISENPLAFIKTGQSEDPAGNFIILLDKIKKSCSNKMEASAKYSLLLDILYSDFNGGPYSIEDLPKDCRIRFTEKCQRAKLLKK